MSAVLAAALATAALLATRFIAEPRGALGLAGACKIAASLCFLALALAGGVPGDAPRRLVVAALVLSAVGDAALVRKGKGAAFAVGLAAFLAAHVAYAAAFVAGGVDAARVCVAAVPITLIGLVVARGLVPRVSLRLRAPVVCYVAAISCMLALAVGTGDGRVVAAAALFYVSDLFVARERFVAPSPWNARVGLPLYYAAQLVFAAGVAA